MNDTDPPAETGISSLICDGMTFQWWAVGGSPALVTVRSSLLGCLRDFTVGDVREFAMSLARKLLHSETQQVPADVAQAAEAESSTNSFLKRGWFE